MASEPSSAVRGDVSVKMGVGTAAEQHALGKKGELRVRRPLQFIWVSPCATKPRPVTSSASPFQCVFRVPCDLLEVAC